MIRHLALASAGVVLFAATASAEEPWDNRIRRLCTNTAQQDCWIKLGAAMCDKDQLTCKDLPEHTAARVIRKEGKRWFVQTKFGNGYVNERWLMVDGSK